MHVLKSRFQMYCSSKEEKEKSFPVLKLVLFPLHIHTSTRDFCLTLPVLFCSADPSVAEIWFYSSERFRGYPLTHRASMWFFFFFAVELSNSLFATLSLADCEGLKTHDFQMLGGQSWQTVAHCWEFFFSGTPEGEEFAFSILQVLL